MLIIVTPCSLSNKTNLKMYQTEQTVKALIEECYINGALNQKNTFEMKRGYHKDFAIFISENDELRKIGTKIYHAHIENPWNI